LDEKKSMLPGSPVSWGRLSLPVVFAAVLVVGGCGSAQKGPDAAGPVFYPPAPEKPRLQFLTSFSGPGDLGAPTASGLEKFVLGEEEQKEGIATPYGLAIFDDKIYVCDVAKRRIEVLDLKKRSFGYMTEDRRLANPVNIFIEDNGTKYVADPTAGAVFVFDAGNALQAILGKELKISPIDVSVRGGHCYVTDFAGNRVVVMDKATGKEVRRMGEQGDDENQFKLISDLAFGPDGDLYVTDKIKAKIFEFDSSGNLKRTIGRLGDNIDELVRPKGIAIDRQSRIWVIDAGASLSPAAWSTEVAKIYDPQGRLLLFFGRPGNEPGNMNLPAKIILDYNHIDLFKRYAVQGASIEFLVFVSNQYGASKINVYGFGEFPVPDRRKDATQTQPAEKQPPSETVPPAAAPPAAAVAPKPAQSPDDAQRLQRTKSVADLYYQSMEQYRAGRLEEARAGFMKVIQSGLIPPAMEETLKGYIKDIDGRLTRNRGGQR
jgi:hypothetical protein